MVVVLSLRNVVLPGVEKRRYEPQKPLGVTHERTPGLNPGREGGSLEKRWKGLAMGLRCTSPQRSSPVWVVPRWCASWEW